MCTVFIIDDDENIRRVLTKILNSRDKYTVFDFPSVSEAKKRLGELKPNIIIVDLYLDKEVGSDIFEPFVENNCAVIVYTGANFDEKTESELIRDGATWLLKKPIGNELLLSYVFRAEKISRGFRLLKRAGRISTNLFEETKRSIVSLAEYTRSKALAK